MSPTTRTCVGHVTYHKHMCRPRHHHKNMCRPCHPPESHVKVMSSTTSTCTGHVTWCVIYAHVFCIYMCMVSCLHCFYGVCAENSCHGRKGRAETLATGTTCVHGVQAMSFHHHLLWCPVWRGKWLERVGRWARLEESILHVLIAMSHTNTHL